MTLTNRAAGRAAAAAIAGALSNTVTPIAVATNKAGMAIKVGHKPDAIAITPNGKTVYVANKRAAR